MKRFLLTGAACTLVVFFLSFVIHGVLLEPYYAELASRGVFRTPDDASGYSYLMVVAQVFMGFAFAWIYMRGVEPSRPWYMQGIRFAIAVICLTTIPWYLIYYVVQPLPAGLVIRQIVFGAISVIVTGLVAAFINREQSVVRSESAEA